MFYFLDACNVETTVANQNQTRLDELGYQKESYGAPRCKESGRFASPRIAWFPIADRGDINRKTITQQK
jgi:hypothetical protein